MYKFNKTVEIDTINKIILFDTYIEYLKILDYKNEVSL